MRREYICRATADQMKQSFLATKSMNHIRPEQHFHFPKSPPTSSLVPSYTNTKTAELHTVLPDPSHRMTSSKLQCIYGSSSKPQTPLIQFQAPYTTRTTKTKTTAGTRGGRPVSPRHQPHKTARTVSGIQPIVNRKQKRSQLSLPGRIDSSLHREGTPLNPRSGELGSRQVGWRTGRPAARGYSIICQD